MNPRQIELARHALGLPNRTRKSYRNYFTAGPGHSDHEDWNAMVEEGVARVARAAKYMGGDDCFYLTRQGAEAALERGERLGAVEFPDRVKPKPRKSNPRKGAEAMSASESVQARHEYEYAVTEARHLRDMAISLAWREFETRAREAWDAYQAAILPGEPGPWNPMELARRDDAFCEALDRQSAAIAAAKASEP